MNWAFILGLYLGDVIKGLTPVLGLLLNPFLSLAFGLMFWACAPIILNPITRNEFRNAWILDSGANDHMTHNPNHFKTYSPCPSNEKIVVAYGTITTVAGKGEV